MITLAWIVQKTVAMPAQWDAWDTEGVMYYLRYECGHGTVWRLHEPGVYWPGRDLVAEFHKADDDADCISFEDFVALSGISLSPTLMYTPYSVYLAAALKTAAKETYGEEGP